MGSFKWTIEKLQEEALRYSCRLDFFKGSPKAYDVARRRNILDKMCAHMISKQRRPWTVGELQQEASKYGSRLEFSKNSYGAYSCARKNQLLDQICSHMPKHVDQTKENHPMFRWTLEKLQQEALKYKTRWEFQKNNGGAYNSAHRRGLLDQICSHLHTTGGVSLSEEGLVKSIKEKYPKTTKLRIRKKNLVPDKPHIQGFDIDIYIPELRKGIEFDGKYWHGVDGLKRGRPKWPDEDLQNYHKIKDDYFKSKGIELLHINEKDWLENQEACVEKCFDFLKNT